MLKTSLFIMLGIIAVAVTAITLFLIYLWWGALKQPPAYALITEKYYVCHKHQALHGGIFGKGPTKKFFQPNTNQWCWKWDWKEIDRLEFKVLATQWYGINWSAESNWWSNERI